MRIRYPRVLAGLVVSALTAASLVAAPPAMASGDDTVTPTEVAAAIATTESKAGDLVAAPVASATDADSAAVTTTSAGVTLDVPKDADQGVSLKAEGLPEVTVELPNADDAANATRLNDGTVVYASGNGSANAVVPTEGGVQMVTTIANSDAPTSFPYKVDVPDGGKVELSDGGALVKDASDNIVLVIPAPWAKDANGTAVPSHFTTDGTTLTQVVEHTNGTFAYPVVADPWWLVPLIVGALTGCAIGAAQGLIQAGAKWAIQRGDWYWNQRLRDAGENCLWGMVFGIPGRVIPAWAKNWIVNALRPHVYNVLRYTVLR